MNTVVRLVAVVVLLGSLGCDDTGPTAPTAASMAPAPPSLPPVPPPVPLVSFPPLSGPSRTFVFDRQVSYPVRYVQGSRFVLYDSGAFALEYATFTYRGAYRDTNGTIEFLFEFGGRGTGTLNGDSLTVLYEETMQHADFENAVYVLIP